MRIAFRLVPRTRSSHDFSAATVANFGFKSGTRIIELARVLSIPKFARRPRRMLANFGIGTLAALSIAAQCFAVAPAAAQDYPTRPVRVLVGFTPGAAADITARVLATRMSQILGQQVVVENKPGAGSNLAADY